MPTQLPQHPAGPSQREPSHFPASQMPPPQSRAPAVSHIPASRAPPASHIPQSRAPAPSRAPSASHIPASRAPSASKMPVGPSRAPPPYQSMAGAPMASMRGVTMGTALRRDISHAPSQATVRGAPSPQPTVKKSLAPPLSSRAPTTMKSVLVTPQDQVMASRQSRYDTLAPQDQQAQDNWAQSLIQKLGACPEGFEWDRFDGGYHCQGKGHAITDELLAEGKGGLYGLTDRCLDGTWDGPYYPHPTKPGKFAKVQ